MFSMLSCRPSSALTADRAYHHSPGNAETTKTSTFSSFGSFVISPIHNWILLTPLAVVNDIVSWIISDIFN